MSKETLDVCFPSEYDIVNRNYYIHNGQVHGALPYVNNEFGLTAKWVIRNGYSAELEFLKKFLPSDTVAHSVYDSVLDAVNNPEENDLSQSDVSSLCDRINLRYRIRQTCNGKEIVLTIFKTFCIKTKSFAEDQMLTDFQKDIMNIVSSNRDETSRFSGSAILNMESSRFVELIEISNDTPEIIMAKQLIDIKLLSKKGLNVKKLEVKK
jgi:hypothetical protein